MKICNEAEAEREARRWRLVTTNSINICCLEAGEDKDKACFNKADSTAFLFFSFFSMKLRASGRVGFLYELKFYFFIAVFTSRSNYFISFVLSKTAVKASETTVDSMTI
jgi:hypothetical protein